MRFLLFFASSILAYRYWGVVVNLKKRLNLVFWDVSPRWTIIWCPPVSYYCPPQIIPYRLRNQGLTYACHMTKNDIHGFMGLCQLIKTVSANYTFCCNIFTGNSTKLYVNNGQVVCKPWGIGLYTIGVPSWSSFPRNC